MANGRGQLSMRPSKRTLERLRERARLTGERHTTLAERYLEEGLKMDECPGVHFVEYPRGRRPVVTGTRHQVWTIIDVVKANKGSVEDAAAYLGIDRPFVETAVRYYGQHREEIDDWIARVDELNRREEAKWRAAQEAIAP